MYFTDFAWFLNKVIVRDTEKCNEYTINCQRWLAGLEGKETFREFTVSASGKCEGDEYDVHLRTVYFNLLSFSS